jgi:hypothetical protein
MTKPSVDDLMAAESRLNRSLAACVVAVLVNLGWVFVTAKATGEPSDTAVLVALAVFVLQVSCYVWFAVSAGRAARILDEPGWKYVTWILAAPFLALVPIPIVSTLIGVSPLSIKFLLGGQLESAIRERRFAD